jgi:ABC transport system ATP-binding/permease protein
MLLTGRNLGKSYGPRLLFTGITLGLEEGERVGLIGANGSGKSTLLRIFARLETPDDGELIARKQLRVSYVSQEDLFPDGKSAFDCVAGAIDENLDEHDRQQRATQLLDRAGFVDPSITTEKLSGGWKKRLAIVMALAREPDLLLLDEPTNHLDIEGILWLEKILAGAPFAALIVSHDRRFLESVANRIIELGRSYPEGFLSHKGTYSEFLVKREEFLAAQSGREKALASGVRREIEWLHRGAKARTTKAKGRIERAGEMMEELGELRQRNARQDPAKIDFNASGRQTRKLIELKHVAKSLGGRELFGDVNFTLAPHGKIGLIGPNGSGKSTLIRILSEEIKPDSGEILRASQLRVVVFDQHREQLNPADTLRHALSPTGDAVNFRGNSMHVVGWAQQFLFRADQLDLPISELSGGEQARVLIARLMLLPADVLILDEPTNDLDIATLDVLEKSLEEFPGAIVLVTHDRYLLDRVSTEIVALDGRGKANLFADLSQWERARESAARAESAAKKSPATPAARGESSGSKRLTWNEQRELEKMEETIHAAEALVASLQGAVADPKILTDYAKSHEAYERLAQAQQEVERLYERWADLSAKQSQK